MVFKTKIPEKEIKALLNKEELKRLTESIRLSRSAFEKYNQLPKKDFRNN